jgi:eukaryotic-like serine/threonine-protein kinase
MFKFITTRPLWVNILAGILLFLLAGWITLMLFGWYTKHGQQKKVPMVYKKPIAEAKSILDKSGFDYAIQDSVYIDSLPRGIVLKQTPEGDALVKNSRTIYIVYNRYTAPMVDLPNVYGYSKDMAIDILLRRGFKIGDTTFKPDFAINSVLEVKVNGVAATTSMKVPMNSRVDMVISSGIGNQVYNVPNMIGMTLAEARAVMDGMQLTRGVVVADASVRDTLGAFVIKQSILPINAYKLPNQISPGQAIDVWISANKPIVDSLGNYVDPTQLQPNEQQQ